MFREKLALERTLLAYIRTALGFIVVGGSLLVMFVDWRARILGAGVLLCAVGLVLFGLRRFARVRARIRGYRDTTTSLD